MKNSFEEYYTENMRSQQKPRNNKQYCYKEKHTAALKARLHSNCIK